MLSVGNVIFVLIEIVHYWARLSKCFCCCWFSASQDCVTLSLPLFFSHVSVCPPPTPPSDSLISASLHLSLKGKKERGDFSLPSMFRPVLRLSCLFCISSAIQDIRRGKHGSGYFIWNNVFILCKLEVGEFYRVREEQSGPCSGWIRGTTGLVQVKWDIQVEKWDLCPIYFCPFLFLWGTLLLILILVVPEMFSLCHCVSFGHTPKLANFWCSCKFLSLDLTYSVFSHPLVETVLSLPNNVGLKLFDFTHIFKCKKVGKIETQIMHNSLT